jgi:hypothetical protein
MSPESREEQILLALSLGPVFPLWGIVETTPGVLACECGGRPNCKPGEHPRWTDYRRKAPTNPTTIRHWLQRCPYANFGVVTGPVTIALDVDVRTTKMKAACERCNPELDEGERLRQQLRDLRHRIGIAMVRSRPARYLEHREALRPRLVGSTLLSPAGVPFRL